MLAFPLGWPRGPSAKGTEMLNRPRIVELHFGNPMPHGPNTASVGKKWPQGPRQQMAPSGLRAWDGESSEAAATRRRPKPAPDIVKRPKGSMGARAPYSVVWLSEDQSCTSLYRISLGQIALGYFTANSPTPKAPVALSSQLRILGSWTSGRVSRRGMSNPSMQSNS